MNLKLLTCRTRSSPREFDALVYKAERFPVCRHSRLHVFNGHCHLLHCLLPFTHKSLSGVADPRCAVGGHTVNLRAYLGGNWGNPVLYCVNHQLRFFPYLPASWSQKQQLHVFHVPNAIRNAGGHRRSKKRLVNPNEVVDVIFRLWVSFSFGKSMHRGSFGRPNESSMLLIQFGRVSAVNHSVRGMTLPLTHSWKLGCRLEWFLTLLLEL